MIFRQKEYKKSTQKMLSDKPDDASLKIFLIKPFNGQRDRNNYPAKAYQTNKEISIQTFKKGLENSSGISHHSGDIHF
jgi:hypothetical protein